MLLSEKHYRLRQNHVGFAPFLSLLWKIVGKERNGPRPLQIPAAGSDHLLHGAPTVGATSLGLCRSVGCVGGKLLQAPSSAHPQASWGSRAAGSCTPSRAGDGCAAIARFVLQLATAAADSSRLGSCLLPSLPWLPDIVTLCRLTICWNYSSGHGDEEADFFSSPSGLPPGRARG